MILKIAIIVLFVLLLISLASSFYFLAQDQGTTKRTLHSLGVRVTLAGAMMLLIGYGVYTGEITSKAPWDAKLSASQAANN
jgi:purine-cytosine permease-like protein